MRCLATASVAHLNIPRIRVERTTFPEGELYIRIAESIKGERIRIVANVTPSDFLELLFLVDAARNAGAKIKEIMIPFISYARQDRLYKRGESIAGGVICSILRSLKIPVVIYDIHSGLLRRYLDFENRSVLPYLANGLPKKDFVVVSPDKGGFFRAKMIAKILKSPCHVIDKKRLGPKRLVMDFKGDVKGKDVLLVDDMISTGTTLIKAARLLKSRGAKDIFCIASHGLFVGDARKDLSRAPIKRIIVSNTLPVVSDDLVRVVNVDHLFK